MAAGRPWLDAVLVNDEMDLLEYRIRLLAPVFSAFLVFESDLTFSGDAKPLHAKAARDRMVAALGRRRRQNISVVTVELTDAQRASPSPWVREVGQRQFIGRWIRERYPNHNVHLSDCDELPDGEQLLATADLSKYDCYKCRLRSYYYGEHCPRKPTATNLVFRTDSKFLAHTLASGYQLRSLKDGDPNYPRACPWLPSFVGWHFSYAMPTSQILHKVQSFSHYNDSFARDLLANPNAAEVIDERVRRCDDIFGRARYPGHREGKAFDGKLPWLPGWPKHPLA